ncbi:probetacellulin isoform X1 [Gallus gallus]|uniref:Probetacellulin n=1 Tax=Gallus gallus TaxID=9031 RepID=A0A8V0Y3E8_CHICK|nr:probetacellulin isoform X1 [Gallus gallus]XP_046772486.1 probetacellulin isoform X1 [Gallus gallus]
MGHSFWMPRLFQRGHLAIWGSASRPHVPQALPVGSCPSGPPRLHHHHGMGSVQAAMGPGWVPAGGKRHPSLPAWREADAGLALFSCVGADANVTEGLPCEGCAGNVTQLRRRGHFSRCPEEYRHYCVKGRCRFLVAEAAPACMCERGYTGARCEQVDIFYLRGDRGQIVVISLIAAVVTLIVFVVCVCLCAHHCRKQRRKRKEEEMETLNKNAPSRSEDVLETDVA